MEQEIWAEVNVNSAYVCSNLGNFKRLTPGKGAKANSPIKTFINKVTGYSSVTLAGCSPRTYAAHKIIARAHIPNPDNLSFVLFKDRDKTNLRADNLYWCSSTFTPNIIPTWLKDVTTGEVYAYPSKIAICLEKGCTVYSLQVCFKKGSLLQNKWKVFDKNPPCSYF